MSTSHSYSHSRKDGLCGGGVTSDEASYFLCPLLQQTRFQKIIFLHQVDKRAYGKSGPPRSPSPARNFHNSSPSSEEEVIEDEVEDYTE